jgi:transposase
MKIKDKYIEKIKANPKYIGALAQGMNVHIDTIERWAAQNKVDGKLTTHSALAILSKEIGVSQNALLAS